MAAEVSDCLHPSTKELFCCLTGRYGSIQIPWMIMTSKQQLIQRESGETHKGTQHSDFILSAEEKYETQTGINSHNEKKLK